MTPYLQMARNNAYANRTLYNALGGLAAADFAAPRPGFFPSLLGTLNHIHEVDLFYVDALTEAGQGRAVYAREDIRDVAALAAAQAAADARLTGFCETDPDPARVVPVERREGMTGEAVGALLLHLFQHQIHHRGQAHVQISAAGIDPPQLDDFFLDYRRAPIAREYFE
jgi:uncharacterized damage-inducible protein DinB